MTLKENGNANGDIEIIFTGLRPGEKLYEELLIGDNVSKTKHKQILRAEEILISRDKLENYLEQILKAKDLNDIRNLKKILQQVVMGYEPEKQIVDILYLQNKRNLD